MPRDIPVGNGSLLVCFDRDYVVRDLFFPHVGQENHVGGRHCRLGIWSEGRFSWVGEDWKLDLRFMEDTLVTQVSLYSPKIEVLLLCHDAVDFHENIFIREVTVENMTPRRREIRLFFGQDLSISGNDVGDTAAYDPMTGGVVHYKGARYFLGNASLEDLSGLTQFATGQKGVGSREGTFRDAEDGELSGNTIAQGSVDSVMSVSLNIDGLSSAKAYYWLTAAQTWDEARRLDAATKRKHPRELIKRTADFWSIWVRKETLPLELVPKGIAQAYRRSLLILRTQIDNDGGIVAANDSDSIQFNRDTYSYVWPRDGALVANALDMAGYHMLSQNFYRFLARVVDKEGYLLHKYNPDGTLASSWHPWFDGNKAQLPIQEDETAIALWALWRHFVISRDIEFIKPLYRSLIKAGADFMVNYLDAETGLPDASYDLWEERRGILSFTVGAIFGGLTAASLFCTVFGETLRAEHYQKVASQIRDAASRYLWRPEAGRFCRMLHRNGVGELQADMTMDASLWGLFAFGLYAVDDPRVTMTMEAMKSALWVRTGVGGMARYKDDVYHRVAADTPGNPWFICTLWYADYLIERAREDRDFDAAVAIIEWVVNHALPSGVLAEQVDPRTGEPLSISPLTWSHATFVATVQRLLQRRGNIQPCPECGSTPLGRARTDDWISRLYSQACDAIRGSCRIK